MCSCRTESRLPLGTRYAVAVPTLTRSSGSSRTGVNPKAYERGDYVTEARSVLPGQRASHLRGRVTVTADVSSPVTHASLSQGRASRSGSSFRSPLRPPMLRRRAASAGWGLPCISDTMGAEAVPARLLWSPSFGDVQARAGDSRPGQGGGARGRHPRPSGWLRSWPRRCPSLV